MRNLHRLLFPTRFLTGTIFLLTLAGQTKTRNDRSA